MKVLQRLDEESRRLPFPIVTIGNFDGLHLGHQAVLSRMAERAHAVGGTVVVLTFDPHPLRVLAPHVELQFLSDADEKFTMLERSGVGVVVRLPFTTEFAAQSPADFMNEVLMKGLAARELFVGQNFRFGRNREGTIQTLLEAAPRLGFIIQALEPVMLHGVQVSSTRIRGLLQGGSVGEAAHMLGRPYVVKGKVVRGDGRGGELGFPTANLTPPEGRVLPADGVYATHVYYEKAAFTAVTYIGTRPTFGQGPRLIETYLLEGDPELYGREIAVAFYEHLRPDRVFDSSDQLAQQIAVDVQQTREVLRNLSAETARAI
jgi:riboflavin kinase/FMN adenylyltransferase